MSARSDATYVGVELKHVRLERSGRLVLDDIEWMIRPAQRWVLAGGNGAGKTQLMKLISGAVWPTPTGREIRRYHWRGEIWPTPLEVKEEIGYLGPERQDKYERYGWNHPVEKIIGTGLYRTDIPLDPLTAADRRRIGSLLAQLGIEHLAGRRFLTLSYGERRLVLLARALAAKPKLLLLDELLNGLDESHRARALRWLERTGRSRLPWVLSTHRIGDMPSSATHALVLEQGHIVYRGPIQGAPLERWLEPEETAPARRNVVKRKTKAARTNAAAQPLIRLHRASVYLDERAVLRNFTFEVRSGECWVIHGGNGSGKTTLLRTLYGDHGVAAGGHIERAGIEPGVPLEIFKRRVGIVAPHLQTDHPRHLTVDEVVQSGRHASIGLNDAPTRADRSAARRALEFFGLARFAPRPLVELSYGQLRRVLFARAWVNRPDLLLLDEPFAGVDAPTRRKLLEHVEQVVDEGAAVIMATHHREEWPGCASHEIEIADGRARYCGPLRAE